MMEWTVNIPGCGHYREVTHNFPESSTVVQLTVIGPTNDTLVPREPRLASRCMAFPFRWISAIAVGLISFIAGLAVGAWT